jgi:hypothetical protein
MPQTRELAQIIDKETGDVNNLRDKKLADATAQQQSGSASTDSVVMKTTSGDYVEIARDSFVGAIKGVMDGLIKGNSYTTLGANDPIAAFNSNALGGITPANLASVLGEAAITEGNEIRFNLLSVSDVYGLVIPHNSSVEITTVIRNHQILLLWQVGGGFNRKQKLVLIPWDRNTEEVYIGGTLGDRQASNLYAKRSSTNGGPIVLYNDTNVDVTVYNRFIAI